jgi:hypothetical protein
MPRKGGGGQTSPDEEEELVRTISEGLIDASLDRTDELEGEEEPEFIYGDIVHDEEQSEPDDLVVVNIPDVRAEQWEVDGGTLADKHPGCPRDNDVIIVVPLVELVDYMPDWDEREEEIPLEQLAEDDVTTFVYPSLRLHLIEPSHLRE